jgi:ATP-dependent Clp protease ATP-binding subunit ClpC
MNGLSTGLVVVRIAAEIEAKASAFGTIEPEHLWMALTKLAELPEDAIRGLLGGDEDKKALVDEVARLRAWFERAGMEPTQMRRKLRHLVGRGPGCPGEIHRSKASRQCFKSALEKAEAAGAEKVDMRHLAEALVDNPPPALANLLGVQHRAQAEPATPSPKPSLATQGSLARFGRDLSALAAQGLLEPLIGRREELRRLAQVLGQKRKGNALLVGDAGVGKTSIVEGLARKIASPDSPPALRERRIVEISIAALLAGTKYRGDFEERIDALLREARADPTLVLFLDEFHTMMGKGGGGIDTASMLKPALARGELHVIAAATTQEYERHIAKDDAMVRRFEVVWIEEPSRIEAVEIVRGAKPGLEKHHGVCITDDAIDAAVDLSIRYLPDQRLPDKALDLIDQAASRRALGTLSFHKAQGVTLTLNGVAATVDRADIARVVATRTRVPFALLAASQQDRLCTLAEHLGQRVLGQPRAIDAVLSALQAAYGGLKDPRRPIASFLFTGPTGVGKTETAKALADFLFGGQESLLRVDLSEYAEQHQIARLLGAPPGYVGHEEPGMLTAGLRRRPASVVLFDEIEKAHPKVLDVMLQILDEGQLTDGQGRKASFREAVVVLTTNLDLGSAHNRLGFGVQKPEADRQADDQEKLREGLRQHLRPELLGRIQSFVRFDPLGVETLAAIAEKAFEDLRKRAEAQQITLPQKLLDQVLASLPRGQFGARDIEHHVASVVGRWLEERHIQAHLDTIDAGRLPGGSQRTE